jgi:ubiquitin-like 1-activating enzyme E1 A
VQLITSFHVTVIEKFEETEGRSAGDVSDADLSSVLKLKKELCTAQVCLLELVIYVFKVNTNHIIHPILLFTLQSVNDSHVPDTLLERLVADTTEFPPVSAVIGGILGQVFSRPSLFIRQDVLQY